MLLTFVSFANASDGKIVVPKGYQAVLNCKASKNSPRVMIARKKGEYVLLINVYGKTQTVELYVENGDMGFVEYKFKHPEIAGPISKYVTNVC